MRGGDRDVVEQAEPHRAVALGVMAGRPHQRHRGRMDAGHHPLHRIDGSPCRQARDLIRFGRGVGVRVERQRSAGGLSHPLQVGGVVHARELFDGCFARSDDLGTASPPSVDHRGHRLGAFQTLGVTRRGLVFAEPVGVNQDHRHTGI